MSPLDILLLAVIQGLTEFLPISSSGHLVLANALLGVEQPGIVTEVVLHLGTLGAVLVYFRRDLISLLTGLVAAAGRDRGSGRSREAIPLFAAIVLGTIPVVIVGFGAQRPLEKLFEDPQATSVALLVTGSVLISTLFLPRGSRHVGPGRGFVVGLFQALALLPGISRSGMTIAGGLHLRVDPVEAARFSFLLSIPAILGAAVLRLSDLVDQTALQRSELLLLGLVVSFAVGYGVIAVLLRIVQRGRFGWFGIYCIVVGLVGWIWIG